MSGWITVREAAQILGVHPSAIPKMIRRGDLGKREERPILRRADVIALRNAREARKAPKEPQLAPRPPDAEHEWLTSAEAAALMGVGPEGVRVRARRSAVVHLAR